MPTLSAGSTVSLSLDNDDVLTTSGNGRFQVTPTTGSKSEGSLTGTQNIGPFQQYVTVSLTALTDIVYSTATNSGVAPAAKFALDSSGNVTGLVGPSGVAVGFPIAIYRLNTTVTAPADTNENTLATVQIPANSMGANGVLRVSVMASLTNNANAKTISARFGGTVFAQQSYPSVALIKAQSQIQNRNSATSQVSAGSTSGASWSPSTSSASGVTTYTIDTTLAQTLSITAQKATAGDTITLESLLVELIPGA